MHVEVQCLMFLSTALDEVSRGPYSLTINSTDIILSTQLTGRRKSPGLVWTSQYTLQFLLQPTATHYHGSWHTRWAFVLCQLHTYIACQNCVMWRMAVTSSRRDFLPSKSLETSSHACASVLTPPPLHHLPSSFPCPVVSLLTHYPWLPPGNLFLKFRLTFSKFCFGTVCGPRAVSLHGVGWSFISLVLILS
jgi:hypothetical protein